MTSDKLNGSGPASKLNVLPYCPVDADPWTKRELQAALRAEGWQRIPSPGSSYWRPDTGKVFNLDTVVMVDGRQVEEWEQWARERRTPAPF